jgi:hypothetical protein
LGKTSGSTQGRNPRHRQDGGMIFTMSFNPTSHMDASKSNLTRPQAGDLGGLHFEITVLKKRAGGAGNRHGGDLDMRLTNLKTRMNHELESR